MSTGHGVPRVSRSIFAQGLRAGVTPRGGQAFLRNFGLILIVCAAAGGFSLLGAQNRPAPSARKSSGKLVFSSAPQQPAAQSLAKLPWAFEPNVGQTDARVKFFARADGANVFLTQDEAVIAWSAPELNNSLAAQRPTNDLRLQFVGASDKAAVSGDNELPGKTNYLLCSDPRKWRTNVPHFSAVSYRKIYPGIDARFYGGPLGLEYDLAVSPGGDYREIVLRAVQDRRLRLDSRGNLLVRAGGREILMRRPEMFQLDGNHKIPVEGGYRLLSDNSFGFRVGPHRGDLSLVIDPSISITYTSFLGGNGAEKGNSVAVDSTGAVYVGGTTTDVATFPETSPTPTSLGSLTGTSKIFVAKIDTTIPGAASLVYLTFIGGSGDDEGGKVAVDNSVSPANLAILGWTTSTDFPTLNPATTTPTGAISLTVSKLKGTGNGFIFSEYYGGSGSEATQGTGAIRTDSTGGGIATDASGNVYVTSDTTSTNLPTPTVPNGFQTTLEAGTTPSGTNNDGFFAKFGASGNVLYSTYFGIAAMVGGTSVASDASGNAYVAGFTSAPSNTFPPLGANSFQSTYGTGSDDGIVLEINPSLVGPTSLVYASYLGGSGTDKAVSIGVDNASPPNAYVTGLTTSADFVPASLQSKSFQPCYASTSLTPCSPAAATSNAFFATISQNATTCAPAAVCLTYASYLGGTSSDSGHGIAVVLPSTPGPSTDVLVTGTTTSSNFPVFCPSQNFTGTQDAFLSSFDPTAIGTASLIVSSLLGGSKTAEANAVATDLSATPPDAIIFGDTGSSDYPIGANPNPKNGFQLTCTSCALGSPQPDAFLTKSVVSTAASGCIAFNPASQKFGTFPVGSTSVPPFNGLVTNAGNASVTLTSVNIGGTNSGDFQILAGTTCTASTILAAGANCSVSIGFVPSVAGAESATLQIADTGANSAQQSLDLSGTGTAPEVSLSPNIGLTFGSVPQGTTGTAQMVTLNNTGNASLTIHSITIDASVGLPNGPASFGLPATSNACTTANPVPAGGSCNIAVNFTPQATGSLTGQVDISDDANNTSGGATQNIALSGTGTTPTPIVGLNPTSLSFGSQNLGTTSAPQPVTVTNSGSASLNFTAIQLTGPNANQFQIVTAGTTCQVGVAVSAPSGTCAIEVEFAPNAAASANAAVTLTDDASPTTQSVPLTGTGTGAVAGYSANSISFGGVSVGTTSSPQTATLTNNGNVALTISNVAIDPSVGIPGDFALLTSGTPCQTVGSVAPGASCTITVSFTPSGQGTITGQVDITDNASPGSQTIALDGTGLQFGVSLSSNSMAFGSVSVGTPSSPISVTLTNTGNQPLTVSSVTFDSAVGTPSDFSFTGTNNCVSSSPLAANATCTITAAFTPATQGNITGQVNVADNGPASPQAISLSGTGTQPVASFNPPSIGFGSVNVGTPSSPQPVTLTNTGNQTMTISSVTIDSAVGTPADFAFSSTSGTPCQTVGSLVPSASCTFTVTFTPSTQGNETGQVDVADDAAGSPQHVPMSGTGTAAGVSLSPGALPFGNQSVGTTSAVQQVTLTNTGNINLVISSLSLTGTNSADFQINSNQTTCAVGGSGVPANGGTCIIAVDFAPQASGPLSASVTITDNAASTPQSIALSGTGTQPGVQFSPTAMTFGSVNTGSTSSPVTVTLTNTGNQSLTISSVTIDLTVGTPADFAFTTAAGSNTCASVGLLAANATCTITATFTPGATGPITGQVDVADDAPANPQVIPLSGAGTAPGVSLLPSTLTFPSMSVGATSPAQTVTLTNTGTSSLTIFSITTAGTNPGDFQIVSGQTTCPSSGSLAASSSCIIAVDFTPAAPGSRFASVSISDNAAGTPQTVDLTGTGTQPAAVLSSASLSFGNVNVGVTATQPSITLTNTGNQSLTISSVKINPSVGTPGDFALSGSNTCETVGSLAAGANCTISVTFKPAAQGLVTGQVDITDDAPGSLQTIALSGTGTAPGVSLTPSSLNLGSEDVGSTSAAQTATLSNTGTGPLTINSIGIMGANPNDFGETNSCPINPQQLSSGNSCIISVTFTPTAKGSRLATLSVSDTGPGTPQTVALSGNGTQPVVAFNPSTGVSFPATVVGAASGTRAITVTNTGDGPLDVSSITFTGTNAGDFSETDNCVGAANAVAPQKSCTINVNFVPTAAGARTANLVMADNAASTTQQVSVGGQATDFQLAASGGSTSATITAGATAIFPLDVNPLNGFAGTVTFGCTNPPPKGSCTVSPPSVQVSGSTPVSFSVNVGTMSNAFLLPRGPQTSPWPRTPRIPMVLWLPLVLLCLVYFRWAAVRRKRLVPRFILVFAVLLLASCGGGSSTTTGGNGTPPGSYTVTATGSVGSGAARQLKLTVTVQ